MKKIEFFTSFIVCAILLQMFVFTAQSQHCDGAYITATTSAAACPGMGQIHITFVGSDLLLDGSDPSLQPKVWLTPTTPGGTVVGDVALPGSGYVRTYSGVAVGSYIVEVKAFCLNGYEWLDKTMLTTATVVSTYNNLIFSASQTRKTMSCRPTGQIGMNITSGSLPYEITITGDNVPAGYSTTIYPVTSAAAFDNLPVGDYTVTAKDGCNTTSAYNVTIQALSQDMPFSSYSTQLSRVGNTLDCSSVYPYTLGINKAGVDWDYYWANFPLYYEYAYTVNNNMADTVWKPYPSPSGSVAPTFQLPLHYADFCAGGNTVQIKFRIIGCPTIYSYNLYTTSYICNKSPWVQNNTTATIDHEGSCTQAKLYLILYPNWGLCYPADWRITPTAEPSNIIKSGTLDGMGSNPPISTATTSAIYERGVEYTVTLTDSDGQVYTFLWKPPLGGQNFDQTYFLENTNTPCLGYQWRFSTSGTFNVGTRLEYLSGPMELPFGPVGTVKFIEEPYNSSMYTVTSSPEGIYVMMNAGTYSFKITNTCGRDTIISRTFTGYTCDPFTYDEVEQFCNKKRIYPQGRIKSISGTTLVQSNYTTYYYILEGPSGTNYGPSSPRVAPGGYLELTEPGNYTIAMCTDNTYGCVFTTMEVKYDREDLALDPSGTIAYLCQGASHGHIFVKGMNGTPPYTFTVTAPKLTGTETVVDTWTITSDANGNGAFYNTGFLGETYTVTINDDCRTSEIPITVQDIRNANIAYTAPPNGIFCAGEEININCVSLGNTTYSWTGPCAFVSNEQRPRPIAALTPCNTGFTDLMNEPYQVMVIPEGCVEMEIRNLYPKVIEGICNIECGIIAAPTASSPQTFCTGAIVANLQANGADIIWYDDNDNMIADNELLENGIYYAAQTTSNNCQSNKRTTVTVIIDDNAIINAPNMPDEVELCAPATLADIPTDGNTNIVWFNQMTVGDKLPLSTPLVNDTTTLYAALEYGNGACYSIQRKKVNIIIATETSAPTMKSPQYFCHGALIANLDTPHNKIVWYAVKPDEGGNPLAMDEKLTADVYYATQKMGDCESVNYAEVEVSLNGYLPPVAPQKQTTCKKTRYLSELSVTGINIKWYDDAYVEITTPANTVAKANHTYYATQTSGFCESAYTAVFITDECYSPKGTVFPFVHTDNEMFDKQFITIAKLHTKPPDATFDKQGYLHRQTPLQTVPVKYYDCNNDDVILGAPKKPGVIGNYDNPGLPINGFFTPPVYDPLTDADPCPVEPIGWFLFEDVAPDDYIVEISRQGFLVRYGEVHITSDDYIGHRELLGGDINGDMKIDAKDVSALRAKMVSYGDTYYEWIYNLKGSNMIGDDDLGILRVNFSIDNTIYTETADWLNP